MKTNNDMNGTSAPCIKQDPQQRYHKAWALYFLKWIQVETLSTPCSVDICDLCLTLTPPLCLLCCNPHLSALCCQTYEKFGVPIWGVTIQNEPEAAQVFESCLYTSPYEETDFLATHLYPTVHPVYPNLQFLGWDHNKGPHHSS